MDERFWAVFPARSFEGTGADASGNPIVNVTDEFLGVFSDANKAIAAAEELPYGDHSVVAQCDVSGPVLSSAAVKAAFAAAKGDSANFEVRVLHHFIVRGLGEF